MSWFEHLTATLIGIGGAVVIIVVVVIVLDLREWRRYR